MANDVKMLKYNSETGCFEDTGDTVGTWTIARWLSPQNFVDLFDDYLNLGGKQYREGVQVGEAMRNTHRTLQACAIKFCLGVVVGLSRQDFTDPRNAKAIESAKEIAQKIENGEMNLGSYI